MSDDKMITVNLTDEQFQDIISAPPPTTYMIEPEPPVIVHFISESGATFSVPIVRLHLFTKGAKL